MRKPLLIVNGRPYHYHEIEISEPDMEVEAERERKMFELGQKGVQTMSYPYTITIGTYIAPAVRNRSLWRIRRWRAPAITRENSVGWPPLRKVGKTRQRLIVEGAAPGHPAIEAEIRIRQKADVRLGWTVREARSCQYVEAAGGILCFRPAAFVILWQAPGQTEPHRFGYLCDYHRPAFTEYIARTHDNPEQYTLKRLHGDN